MNKYINNNNMIKKNYNYIDNITKVLLLTELIRGF